MKVTRIAYSHRLNKGYTEALTDSDGEHHGQNLGRLLTVESDRIKERNRRRAKLRSIANNAGRRGDQAEADRIHRQRTDRHRTRLPVPDSSPPHHRPAESETSERLTTC